MDANCGTVRELAVGNILNRHREKTAQITPDVPRRSPGKKKKIREKIAFPYNRRDKERTKNKVVGKR